MQIETVAYFHSPFATKFGVPKQSGLVPNLKGEVVFEAKYRNVDALRGIEEFDYVWLIWGFSANRHAATSPVVRPPLLGGNAKMGVFATRSPFRPNPIGLSSVRINGIKFDQKRGPVLEVLGADLMDGTPIYDIKPYVAYADAHIGVRSGFVDSHAMHRLKVVIPDHVAQKFTDNELDSLRQVLELDPRPQYQNRPDKVYGMDFAGHDVRFVVTDDTLIVV